MEKTKTLPATVDEYISKFPADVKKRLQMIRKSIKSAAPKAEEVISYGMPGYRHNGMLVYFAGYANHIGFYPGAGGILEYFKELNSFKSAKGSVQFPHDKAIPMSVISKIVKFRIRQNEEKGLTKKTTAKKEAKKTVAKSDVKNTVDDYMKNLDHPFKKEVEVLRKIIKSSNKKIKERIKWNAPSYYCPADILTFNLHNTKLVQLVFHHPKIVTIKSPLLEGEYKDRRLVHFHSMKEINNNKKEFQKIIDTLVKLAIK